MLAGLAGSAAAVMIGAPVHAAADPNPAPPDVNSYAPVPLPEYEVMDGAWYAFSTPEGLTCVLQRRNGGYGCSGPLPGAPNGANLVSGGAAGAPTFSNTDKPVFAVAGDAKPLPARSRLSFQAISCGTDGVVTSCLNSRDQTGFVISPAGSFVVGEQSSDIMPNVQIG